MEIEKSNMLLPMNQNTFDRYIEFLMVLKNKSIIIIIIIFRFNYI